MMYTRVQPVGPGVKKLCCTHWANILKARFLDRLAAMDLWLFLVAPRETTATAARDKHCIQVRASPYSRHLFGFTPKVTRRTVPFHVPGNGVTLSSCQKLLARRETRGHLRSDQQGYLGTTATVKVLRFPIAL